MKTRKLLSVILAFLMLFTASVWVFAEETTFETLMNAEMIALRDNIAEKIKETEDGWTAVDMVLYEKIPDTTLKISDDTKQKILDTYINESTAEDSSLSDRARIEIVLKAIGIDSTQLYKKDVDAPYSNATTLKASDITAGGHYSAPWLLLADIQGNLNLSEEQKNSLITILSENSQNGTFAYEWEGVSYPDYDTSAVVLTALAHFYDSNEMAKTIVDDVITVFESNISETGSLGSANTDAMAIIGYIALGKNPAELKNTTTEKSIIDGLLSYVNDTNDGFTFYGVDNFLATEQGFRALVGLSLYDGTSYNIYDFSENETVAGRETKEDIEGGEEIIPPEENETYFDVSLTITANEENWIDNAIVSVAEGETVYHALIKGLLSANMTQTGAEDGYVKSITKGDVTLTEFAQGENSGWLYKVNGQKATVSLNDYVLNENDSIVWYYEGDWKKDDETVEVFVPNTSKRPNTSNDKKNDKDEQENIIQDEDKEEENKETTEAITFADTNSHWASSAISYISQKGIMQGVSDGIFAPDMSATRAQLVTMLYRLSGDKTTSANVLFDDVPQNSWYKDSVLWASENSIVQGADGKFLPDNKITREELAVLLYRYAQKQGLEMKKSDEMFTDSEKISNWAIDAFSWAKEAGIITGREDGSADPKTNVTRAEIATVLERFIKTMEK